MIAGVAIYRRWNSVCRYEMFGAWSRKSGGSTSRICWANRYRGTGRVVGDLSVLVSDAESLIASLSEVADEEWVGDVRTAWWELEVPHAVSLDEERPPTLQELDTVNDVVTVMELLLEQEVAS